MRKFAVAIVAGTSVMTLAAPACVTINPGSGRQFGGAEYLGPAIS